MMKDIDSELPEVHVGSKIILEAVSDYIQPGENISLVCPQGQSFNTSSQDLSLVETLVCA